MDPNGLPERPLRYSDEARLPYWPTFIEKLLLTIIDANPLDDRLPPERSNSLDRKRRLDSALKALFGKSYKSRRKESYLLHGAVAAASSQAPTASMQAFESTVLNWPKAEQTRKISKNASFRSNEKLTQGNSKNSRLAKLKDFEALHRRYLEEAGLGYRHPEEEDMLNDLFAVDRILRRWQIPTIIDPAALGLGSLWGAKGS